MSFLSTTFFLLAILIISAPSPGSTKGENDQRKKTLVLGKVSSNPAKQIKQLRPVGEYVISQLQGSGITHIKIIFAKNNQELINLIKSGKVDWITESVFSALIFEQQAGARIFLKRWKKNTEWYHSVFIARKDSGIDTLNQLPGKTLALEDDGSTTGFFLPVLELMKNDISATYLPRHNSVLKSQVGYVFSKDELNISSWVHQGLVHVGAYSNTDWASKNKTPIRIKKDLKIIAKTADYPRMLELLAPHVSNSLEKKLSQVLLNAEFDQAGIKALKKYQRTTRFERLDKNTLDAIDSARTLLPEFYKHSFYFQPATEHKDVDLSPL